MCSVNVAAPARWPLVRSLGSPAQSPHCPATTYALKLPKPLESARVVAQAIYSAARPSLACDRSCQGMQQLRPRAVGSSAAARQGLGVFVVPRPGARRCSASRRPRTSSAAANDEVGCWRLAGRGCQRRGWPQRGVARAPRTSWRRSRARATFVAASAGAPHRSAGRSGASRPRRPPAYPFA